MKWQAVRPFLEVLSFMLWMVFTLASIALAGLGIEGILLAAFLVVVSGTQPDHLPLAATSLGLLGVALSILWRRIGVDHLHYLAYDSSHCFEETDDSPSGVLLDLIHEVEDSSGYARNDARAKAKVWLIDHASSLDEEDVLLARTHFSYLLPPGWGP